MNFNANYYELKNQHHAKLAYEKDTDTYDILIFADTGIELGFFNRSDVICVFEDKTGALVALTERVDKKSLNFFQRIYQHVIKRHMINTAPVGYECFVYDKGAYFEYQYYRRWWYDLNLEVGAISILPSVSNGNR